MTSPELTTNMESNLEINKKIASDNRDITQENITEISEKMAAAPVLSPSEPGIDYTEAITKFFQTNKDKSTIEFQIPIMQISDSDQQKQLLTVIGSALRRNIFKYCEDLIASVPADEKALIELPIGETIMDIRHSQTTDLISSIYVYVKKESGHIFVNVINPSHYDPENTTIQRPESGSLLVPLIENSSKNDSNNIKIHKAITTVTDPSQEEIVGTDCKVNIDLTN